MPFSKGHRPPKEGRGEVLGDTEVGVVVFEETAVPGVTLEVGSGD